MSSFPPAANRLGSALPGHIRNPEDDEEDSGPGLISLDMGAFGSGSLSDPLRHAVGMRTAQDACKMRMWNSFATIFQNTIFHGEQDPEIKRLRHGGTLEERLAKGKQLKDDGNAQLKAATAASVSQPTPGGDKDAEQEKDKREVDNIKSKVDQLESFVLQKEHELKALRKQLAQTRAELEAKLALNTKPIKTPAEKALDDGVSKDLLEKAISNYEKAAGLLRYVECIRPDWRNDDGSYKGIEDEHLRVDDSALHQGDETSKVDAKELVTSCYLNIALAYQKLGDFEKMKMPCDEVLNHINPESVKALYRRAQARTLAPAALGEDLEKAIEDLQTAAHLAPQDKDVRSLLTKLRTQKKKQEATERSTFSGLFNRGEVVKDIGKKPNYPDEATLESTPEKWDLNDPRVQAMLDIHPGPNGFVQ
eukprot:CAMPEP_0206601196 /NCGR_PEP_ID=MMETSP0325_2-20121206/46441_1 /ASSEMBLY_ACC=CAM_ASM_000347 /TAXON_ID=2866 /ORGANISM="Crypthecodinium cohnii, Strain Seligo" /LENGTH=420 /DNA_ID=CAMNT_0054113033 /DNA_START=26 /DNA_END=1288 /DNA_ORIENTATION=-